MSLACGCWDIHLLGGNSNSAIMINILAFAFKLLASSLSTTTPPSQPQLNSLPNSYGFPFKVLSQPWPSVQVFPNSNFRSFPVFFTLRITLHYVQTNLILSTVESCPHLPPVLLLVPTPVLVPALSLYYQSPISYGASSAHSPPLPAPLAYPSPESSGSIHPTQIVPSCPEKPWFGQPSPEGYLPSSWKT